MKKLKNEKELVKKAIAEGMKYGEKRGVVEFEPTDSANEKIEYIYRLLVHDKVIQPIPQDQISQLSMKHKLAIWASKLKWDNGETKAGIVNLARKVQYLLKMYNETGGLINITVMCKVDDGWIFKSGN